MVHFPAWKSETLQNEDRDDYSDDDFSWVSVLSKYLSERHVRFISVPNCKGETLLAFIRENIAGGSVIVLDEWNGHNGLAEIEFMEEVVKTWKVRGSGYQVQHTMYGTVVGIIFADVQTGVRGVGVDTKPPGQIFVSTNA